MTQNNTLINIMQCARMANFIPGTASSCRKCPRLDILIVIDTTSKYISNSWAESSTIRLPKELSEPSEVFFLI